ncbi:response regulator [Nocardioides kongjuensis]|uniref:DNA-binding NarL/FixJ family response regulator n=1 Tax=Nocardioides kongjuensis TaxID=349522 RepID=A0A852R6Y9_9ACTN|nr:response regulator transcription factor [Nocardioides kongjuensis]NYD30633.1 DNA-binding NarL/FixJ family response regulator [Nocardioides kongjuensis]
MAQTVSRPAPARPTRIVVVDDHLMFAQLLAITLADQPDMECVGIAGDVAVALEMVASLQPDLVLMDARLRDGDGVAATAELVASHPRLRVAVLSGYIDTTLMRRAAEAGACALHPKDGDVEEILHAVRTARCGSFVVQPRLLRNLGVDPAALAAHPPSLSAIEHEVLQFLAAGLDASVIAQELGIPVGRCRGHVQDVLTKLGAPSPLEAVVVALRSGLVGVSDVAS